jgi:hypothetical protein
VKWGSQGRTADAVLRVGRLLASPTLFATLTRLWPSPKKPRGVGDAGELRAVGVPRRRVGGSRDGSPADAGEGRPLDLGDYRVAGAGPVLVACKRCASGSPGQGCLWCGERLPNTWAFQQAARSAVPLDVAPLRPAVEPSVASGRTASFTVDVVAFGKSGEDRSEDAFGWDVRRGRFALADGASSSWQAGQWAEALVGSWVEDASRDPVGADLSWVSAARARFADRVETERLTSGNATAGWLADAAADRGAFAAFLGLDIGRTAADELAWEAKSVGDVTLVQVVSGRIECTFPVGGPAEFGSHPDLIASAESGPVIALRTATGRLRTGSILLMMTDALAEFTLRHPDERLIDLLCAGDSAVLRRLFIDAIEAGHLVRDDVTLLRLKGRDRSR